MIPLSLTRGRDVENAIPCCGLVLNGLLTLTALGWLAWISVAPRYWFPGAYAAQGPRGEEGPRGERGPEGPAGPVGPDAADAIDELSLEVTDLSERMETIEGELSDLQGMAGSSELESAVEDVQNTVSAICDELSYYEGALADIWLAAC
jgi:hypothetical protein